MYEYNSQAELVHATERRVEKSGSYKVCKRCVREKIRQDNKQENRHNIVELWLLAVRPRERTKNKELIQDDGVVLNHLLESLHLHLFASESP